MQAGGAPSKLVAAGMGYRSRSASVFWAAVRLRAGESAQAVSTWRQRRPTALGPGYRYVGGWGDRHRAAVAGLRSIAV